MALLDKVVKAVARHLPMDEASQAVRRKAWQAEIGPVDDTLLYHGTHSDFDEFEIGDLGFHVGTAEQANKRLRALSEYTDGAGANVMPVYTRRAKTLDLPDVGEWNNPKVVAEALAGTPWGRKYARDLREIADAAAEDMDMFEDATAWRQDGNAQDLLAEIRRMIEADGYDSVRYHNQVENAYGDRPALTRSAQKRRAELILRAHELNMSKPTNELPKGVPTRADIRAWIDAKDPEVPAALQKQIDDVEAELEALNSQTESPYSYIIFDPSNIRGRFAQFDPSQSHSSKLLAAVPAAIGAGGLLALSKRQQETA